MNCVNPNSPEFKELLKVANINPYILAAKVSVWQDNNGVDNFPVLSDLNIQIEDVDSEKDFVFNNVVKDIINKNTKNVSKEFTDNLYDNFSEKLKDDFITNNIDKENFNEQFNLQLNKNISDNWFNKLIAKLINYVNKNKIFDIVNSIQNQKIGNLFNDKMSMSVYGITNNQKSKIPLINKLLYKGIIPGSYDTSLIKKNILPSLIIGRNLETFKKLIDEYDAKNSRNYSKILNINQESYNKREDSWLLSNGLPQKHNTFKFIGKGFVKGKDFIKDDNGENIYEFVNPVINKKNIDKQIKKQVGQDTENMVMGNYALKIGVDEIGHYAQYTDRWDINVGNNLIQKVVDATQNPFIVTGKIYHAVTVDNEGGYTNYYTHNKNNPDIQIYNDFVQQIDTIENDTYENDYPANRLYEKYLKEQNQIKISEIYPKSKTSLDYLKKIINDNNNVDLIQQLAKHIEKYVKANNVDIILYNSEQRESFIEKYKQKREFTPAAVYDNKTNSIHILDDGSYNPMQYNTLILHEILHSISFHELKKDTLLNKEFQKFFNHASKYLNVYKKDGVTFENYAMLNTDEFLVGLFTDADFINRLRNIPSLNTKEKNLFVELINKFLKVFQVTKKNSFYEQAFSIATNIINDNFERQQAQKDDIQKEETNSKIIPTSRKQKELDLGIRIPTGTISNTLVANIRKKIIKFNNDNISNNVRYELPNPLYRDQLPESEQKGKSPLYQKISVIKYVGASKTAQIRMNNNNNNQLGLFDNPASPQIQELTPERAEAIESLFNENPELKEIFNNDKNLYSEYLDSIFPDSKVKDIVYHGGEKKDVKLFQYWTKSYSEAYMYAKANITKGGNITERNPINSITKVARDYFDTKYGNNTYSTISLNEYSSQPEIWMVDFDENGIDFLKNEYVEIIKQIEKDYSNQPFILKKLSERDKELLKNIQTVFELYNYVKIESESDLMKQYDDNDYINNIDEYKKARKYVDENLDFKKIRNNIGKITTAIIDVTNPYKKEIVQEDLRNDRDAYKNGHDGAFLMDGEHFFIKNNTNQTHILGSKQDIINARKFINKKNNKFDDDDISTISNNNKPCK